MKPDDHEQDSGDRVSIVLLFLSLPVGLFSCFILPNPVVAAVFLGMFVATGMHKFIEVKDPQGLEMNMPLPGGMKATAKMTGAVATLIVVGGLCWWGLTKQLADQQKQLADQQKQLEIADNAGNDDYLVKTEAVNHQGSLPVGKITLYDKLLKLKRDKPFSPFFMKIQSDCPDGGSDRKSLCGIPDSFNLKIIGSSNELTKGEAIVCGQDYKHLVGQVYEISQSDGGIKISKTVVPRLKIKGSAIIPLCGTILDASYDPKLVVGSGTLDTRDRTRDYMAKLLDQ
jgi:hypothetical protein